MAATIATLGARALRRLGVAVVAASDRPALTATTTAASIAASALQRLGVVVPASNRPTLTATVSVTVLANRALQAMGVPVPQAERATDAMTIPVVDVAAQALRILGVTAADETPGAADATVAAAAVNAVHAQLIAQGLVDFAASAIPRQVSDEYAMLAALHLASTFGKAADATQQPIIEARVRRYSLAKRAQALAEARVLAIHDSLVAAGIEAYPSSGILQAVAGEYVALCVIEIAPLFGQAADVARIPVLEEHIRRAALVGQAQAMAEAKVAAVHDGLVASGVASWSSTAIPRALAEEYAGLVALELQPVFGGKADLAVVTAVEARVRRFAVLLGSQPLAEEAVMAVHSMLDATGRTRWTIFDIPDFAEDSYVTLAAAILAPTYGIAADARAVAGAHADLARLVSLPSSGAPVVADYF